MLRILIQGKRVQEVDYRIFLLEKALESDISRIYARNINDNKVELLLSDDEGKLNNFYQVIKRERPKAPKLKLLKKNLTTIRFPFHPSRNTFNS